MSNALFENLEGKIVKLSASMSSEDPLLLFLCEYGYGCDPDNVCDKIYGRWVSTGKPRD